MHEHYVYVVYLGNEVIYVGSGKGERYKHVSNGKSHNQALNLLYRQGIEVRQEFAHTGLTELTARVYEQELIDKYKPIYNTAKAANDQKKALHKELTEEIESIRAAVNPTESNLWRARSYYYLWLATSDYTLLQASFAISKSTQDGNIAFSGNDLSLFMDKYLSNYNKMFFVQCQASVGSDVIYRTTVDDVVSEVYRRHPNTSDYLYRQMKNYVESVKCSKKMQCHQGQLTLF